MKCKHCGDAFTVTIDLERRYCSACKRDLDAMYGKPKVVPFRFGKALDRSPYGGAA